MTRKMTKAQKADALLEAARAWQARKPRHCLGIEDGPDSPTEEFWAPDGGDWWFNQRCDDSASAALSEVCALGFDIVNADGSDCEKVAEAFETRRPEDGEHAASIVDKLRPVRR